MLALVFIISFSTVTLGSTDNVCTQRWCQCSQDLRVIHCDTKNWTHLDGFDFPSEVRTLTMIGNQLTFNAETDITKINALPSLTDMSINQNPLGKIPSFNNAKIRFLSLQDASITSAQFPSSYTNCALQTISLNNNKIRAIHDNDFVALSNSRLAKLRIDSASLTSIDRNAFAPLQDLQSLSLNNNQLKSSEFLSNMPRLSSIHLDDNQFTALPPQLSVPGRIKTYSFRHNSITVIDEGSPLNTWSKMNWTDIRIYLANNTIDCCLSLWLVGFLKTSPRFVEDRSELICATPVNLAGKLLMDLHPDQMHCGGDLPSQSWWTTGRIIAVVGACVGVLIIGMVILYVFIRRRPSRSGYTEINDPYVHIDTGLPSGPVFPTPDDDDDEQYAPYSRITDTRHAAPSEAPTYSTGGGTYAADGSHVGYSAIDDAAALPHLV